jgi:hypothetical protein
VSVSNAIVKLSTWAFGTPFHACMYLYIHMYTCVTRSLQDPNRGQNREAGTGVSLFEEAGYALGMLR